MRVYFYCRNEPGNLQEDVITLAEGLQELGVPFSGNCDYWLRSTHPDDYLIRHDPDIHPDDCDIVVVNSTWPYWIRMKTFDLVRRPLPEGLFRKGRRYVTVYMDTHDGHRTVSWEPEFRQFDLILRTKLNRRAWRPDNIKPWTMPLEKRMIDATLNAMPFEERRKSILINYGASHPYPHGARDLSAKIFEPAIATVMPIDRTKDDLSKEPTDPYEKLMWSQTGGRFSRSYYERLKASQCVACFCGELIPPMPWRDPQQYLVGGNKAKLKRMFFEGLGRIDPRPPRSVQWDSFRFWESLAAGCAAFNIDLDHYGVEIPVMPENWKHYIGVDLARPQKVIERLRDEPEILGKVAASGKEWAMQHYSPRRMAQRLLDWSGVASQSPPKKLQR